MSTAYARSETWKLSGLCAQVDPDLWFPDVDGNAARAMRICRQCPVQARCLEYALDNGEREGIWGGLTEREREPLLAVRALSAAAVPKVVGPRRPVKVECPCTLPHCARLVSESTRQAHHRRMLAERYRRAA